jgi:hypothetical protein
VLILANVSMVCIDVLNTFTLVLVPYLPRVLAHGTASEYKQQDLPKMAEVLFTIRIDETPRLVLRVSKNEKIGNS